MLGNAEERVLREEIERLKTRIKRLEKKAATANKYKNQFKEKAKSYYFTIMSIYFQNKNMTMSNNHIDLILMSECDKTTGDLKRFFNPELEARLVRAEKVKPKPIPEKLENIDE